MTRGLAGAPVRLLLLHHAGGSAASYRPWRAALPPEWEVLVPAVSAGPDPLPRGQVVARLLPDLLREPRPAVTAVWGHSMGARIAHDLTAAVLAHGARVHWLGLSGHAPDRATGVPPALRSSTTLAALGSDELCALMAGLGGLPESVTGSPAVWSRVETRLRCHLALLTGPLPAARLAGTVLDTFAAVDDPVAPPAAMARWHAATGAQGTDHVGSGGHFWFHHDPGTVPRILRERVGAAASAA